MPGDAVKLKLPPGFFKNSTEYAAAGRYVDGDLVRWHNGAIKPVNGWRPRYDFVAETDLDPLWSDGYDTEAVRSGIITTDATAGLDLWLGSNKAIYHISNTNAVDDVTPASFVAQSKDADFAIGYGLYRYSFGQYGTPRPQAAGVVPNAFSWGFAAWGSWPMAVAREISGLPVFVKKDTDTDFVDITGSPEGGHDILVTDERFLMVVGQKDDYRKITWSDQEDYEEWTPAVDNQAGDINLPGSGKLLRGVKVINQILVLSENDAFAGQYIGPPYVYGFNRVGDRCGVIGPQAVATTDTFAMWISGISFYMFDGTVRPIECEVLDHYLATRSFQQRSKTTALTISDYSEIWWFYQSNDSTTGEPDLYLVYNYALNTWYTGSLNRTFGIDADPLTYVMMISSEGVVYDHEVLAAGRDGRVPYIETGPLELESGGRLLGIAYVFPDASTSDDVKMDLSVRDAAQDAEPRYSRTFDLLDPTSTMGIMGRDIRMKLYGALMDPNWTIGDFRVLPTGTRGPGR